MTAAGPERVGLHGGSTDPAMSAFHSAMLEVVTRIVDGDIARDVWNEDPPALWGIDNRRSPLGLHSSLTAWEMPLAPQVWQERHGAQVVATLAGYIDRGMRKEGAPPAGARRHVCGVALSAEAWVLDFPAEASQEERLAAQEFAAQRGVADHPWGVEAKNVIAVSLDGWRFNVTRHRNTGDGPALAEPPEGGMGGSYPEALDLLLVAMRGARS